MTQPPSTAARGISVIKPLAVILTTVLLASCGENPELVQKREQQAAEIARLRGDLALIEEKLRNLPPDRSEELAEARVKAEAQAAEVARLEQEVAELEARKRAAENEFQEYRAKYAIR